MPRLGSRSFRCVHRCEPSIRAWCGEFASRRDDAVGWPQLYTDVAGGAHAAQVIRSIFLGEHVPDARHYLEWNEQPLNCQSDRARQAERIAQAEVHVFCADQYADICHELVDGHQAVLQAYGIADHFQPRLD